MIPTLRILTRKSKLRFGKKKELTVQKILDLRQPLILISAYYKLTSINFTEDILIELKITKDYRIEKPSSNKDEYYRFLNENGYEIKNMGVGSDIMKKRTGAFSKSQLQGFNHGR